MAHLGPYVAIGMKDLKHRADVISGNVKVMQENFGFIRPDDKASIFIKEFIKLEDNLGIVKMDSANNNQELKIIFEN